MTPNPSYDTYALYIIATNVLVPLVFCLAMLGRYGRLSWYIVLLSLVAFIVSVAGIAVAGHRYQYIWYENVQVGPMNSCGWPIQHQVEKVWCKQLEDINPFANASDSWYYSQPKVIWSISSFWMAYTLIKLLSKPGAVSPKITDRIEYAYNPIRAKTGRIHNAIVYLTWSKAASWIWSVFFFLSWGLAFTYQYILFSVSSLSKSVSMDWSFGQIIAILVWVPIPVEYIYLLISELNPPLLSTRNILTTFKDGIEKGQEYRLQAPLIVTTASKVNLSAATTTGSKNSTSIFGRLRHASTTSSKSSFFSPVLSTTHEQAKYDAVGRSEGPGDMEMGATAYQPYRGDEIGSGLIERRDSDFDGSGHENGNGNENGDGNGNGRTWGLGLGR